MTSQWMYTNRDGSVLYGVHWTDTARIATKLVPAELVPADATTVWDELKYGAPPTEPLTGAYL